MRYYYIPLSSRNYTFENIFSTESISPERYYEERNFGFNYFYSIPKFSHDSALILFTEIPSVGNTSENEQDVNYILAISEQTLDQNSLITVDAHILGYLRTIYLNSNNFKILFFSERDRKLLQLRAATSLPTKTVSKYTDRFQLINQNETVKVETKSIKQLQFSKDNLQENVEFDRRVNFFKGLVYGIVGGVINQVSPEDLTIKRLIRQLLNSIAELRNRIDTHAAESGNYQRPIDVKVNPRANMEKRILEEIAQLDAQILSLYPEEVLNDDDFKKIFVKLFEQDFSSESEAESYFRSVLVNDKIFADGQFARLKAYILANSKLESASEIAAGLRTSLLSFLKASKSVTESAKVARIESYEHFKSGLSKLNRWLNSAVSNKRNIPSIPLHQIEYDNKKHSIAIASQFLSIHNQELSEYVLIVNILLQNPKKNKSEVTKDQLLSVVRQVESVFSKGKETQLYKYLNNTVNSYSIENANSVVFKNFVAFVFNPDSLEKLNDFLEAKNIVQSWMAFSFWCTFNGFAQVSQNFLSNVFQRQNKDLQMRIDEYLNSIVMFNQIIVQDSKSKTAIDNSTIQSSAKSQSYAYQLKKTFYSEVIEGKFDIPADDISYVFENHNASEIAEQLRKKYGINKKDGKKLAASYIDYQKSGNLF